MKSYLITLGISCSCFQLTAQNVGIGTTTPAVRLHIVNNTDELIRLQGAAPYLSLYNGGSPIGYVQAYGADLLLGTFNGNPTGAIRFYNNNIENMRIMPNGNVGIANSTPGAPLSFPNLVGNKISFWRSGANNDFGIGINSGVMQFYTAGMDRIAFGYGNANPGAFTETITMFTGNGYLGLGTTSPQVKLHVNANAEALRLSGSGNYLSFYNGSTYKGYLWNKDPNDIELGTAINNTTGNINFRTHGIDGMTVESDGRVRVGPFICSLATGNLLPLLSVTKGIGFKSLHGEVGEWSIYYPGSAEQKLTFCYNGSIKARVDQDDGSWDEVSDSRLKENFQFFKPVLQEIKQLNVLTYHYKTNNREVRSFGLIAQNVRQYFPEIVSVGGRENLLGIDYSKTGVLAIKAIQEQQELIENQQVKINALTNELNALRQQVQNLVSGK